MSAACPYCRTKVTATDDVGDLRSMRDCSSRRLLCRERWLHNLRLQ